MGLQAGAPVTGPVVLECFPGRYGGRGGEQGLLAGAARLGRLDQDGQLREPFPDPLVDRGAGAALLLGPARGFPPAHRAGDRVRGPGGILGRPFGDVEVEAADLHQHGQVFLAGPLLAVPAGAVLEPLLPRGGGVGGQVQAADAGVVGLDVSPEQSGEHRDQVEEALVVHAGAAFVEVADQGVADRRAADLVAVD